MHVINVGSATDVKISYDRLILIIKRMIIINRVFANECRVNAMKKQRRTNERGEENLRRHRVIERFIIL